MPPPSLAPPSVRPARDALLRWFARHARDFPWRHDRTPYRVLVAEAMLQQTRAETVVPYFERWMRALPDLHALARAGPDTVLRLWEGLGYYRRAHALRRAAQEVVHERGGRFPDQEAELRTLPGVGPYTAAAVAAFAFGRAAIAIDGNVRRVCARLLADPAPRDADLRAHLAPLLPARAPGRTTEALIELGATVCRPTSPRCDLCPLASVCSGRTYGRPEAFPAAGRRSPPRTRRRYAALHLNGDRLWLIRRPEGGLLAGLWGPPQQEEPPPGRFLPEVAHRYSHFALRLTPVVATPGAPPPPPPDGGDGAWCDPATVAELPLSTVDRKVVALARDAGLLTVLPSRP